MTLRDILLNLSMYTRRGSPLLFSDIDKSYGWHMVWSARCILNVELCREIFETIHRVRRELSKPTERPLFERSGEDLAPYRLIRGVEIHLCFVEVHVLVQICRTIIKFDTESLPFGRKLFLHDLISERVSFWIIIIILDYVSSFELLSGRLLIVCLNGC